ncbi:unnamed protein product, partial [Didymodactylos carnosus]
MYQSEKTKRAHGVAVCLDQSAAKVWNASGSAWEAVSSRILTVRLGRKPINITVTAVYAPVNPANGQKSEVEASEDFYKCLQETIDKVQKQDMVLIMGDFNARLGQQQNLTAGEVVGRHTVDVENLNGELLVDFCSINNMVVTNTFFEHKPVHQTSWMHPGTKEWHMLDYTLVNRKFRTSVHDVRAYRAAGGAIGTDHHLMRTKVRIHLKCRQKKKKNGRLKLDPKKLQNQSLTKCFEDEVEEKRKTEYSNDMSLDEKYANFVKYVRECANKLFQSDDNTKPRKPWLTDEILDIVKQKASAFLNWQNHRGLVLEHKFRNSYRALTKLVKRKVEERQNSYWEEISLEIENAVKQNDPATAYALIRRLRGGKNSVECMPIQDKDGNLLTATNDRLERWKEYFCEMLNVHTVVDPRLLEAIPLPSIDPVEEARQDKVPDLKEVMDAIKQ